MHVPQQRVAKQIGEFRTSVGILGNFLASAFHHILGFGLIDVLGAGAAAAGAIPFSIW